MTNLQQHHGHDHGDEHGTGAGHSHDHGHGAGLADPCEAEPGVGRQWTVDEHLADVLAAVSPLPPLELQLLEAQGCLTVDEIVSTVALPPFDNSSRDGYAVRVADLAGATKDYPSVLTVVGDVAAGAAALPVIGPGQCARIMTGAPLPPGAEAVVPVEWTDAGSGSGKAATTMAPQGTVPVATGEVRIFQSVEPGGFVRWRGEDIAVGQPLLLAGTRLGPTQIGLLAATGHDMVRVRPRPRVVVLSTGSELVQPGTPVGPGQIPDSNSFALTAAARDAGALAYRVGGVPDEAERLREVIDDQLTCADLIVTSGGVSVGAYDVVKEALGEQISFRKLRMQPGKPQGFGVLEGSDGPVPLLALPGNPVSAYISFELFVRPAIQAMLGATEVHRPEVTARLTQAIGSSPAGRRQFLRVAHDAGAGTVTPVGGTGSHLVGALAQANALLVVDEDATAVDADAEVRVILLDHSTSPVPSGVGLTHVDASGAARMVDVSEKATTARTARATGRVLVSSRVVEFLRGEGVPKGDALSVARIAGIMGAKRTPLCHPVAVSGVTVDLVVTDEAVEISATVRTADRTGVEMEALTAVAVAGLTVIDMVKAVDKGARIDAVQVEEKAGGKSGDWHRADLAGQGGEPGRASGSGQERQAATEQGGRR